MLEQISQPVGTLEPRTVFDVRHALLVLMAHVAEGQLARLATEASKDRSIALQRYSRSRDLSLSLPRMRKVL